MSKEIYAKLRQFLDAMPGGFPESGVGIELRILEKLFSPEEAELAMKLKEEPEEVSSIAHRTQANETELAEKLENMAQKGLIFRTKRQGQPYYQAFQFLVGIYEFQLKNLDHEFSELFEQYLPYYGLGMAKVKTGQLRKIPIESALEKLTGVAPYNKVRELVKGKDFISVQQCICRKEQGLLGKECGFPQEVCMGFGDFGRFYVDNGMGRQIDEEEALRILELAQDSGLVISPTNSREVDFICCCCSCCCPSLRFAKMSARPTDMIHSQYFSKIDPDLCTGCEACMDRCPMDAIKPSDGVCEMIDGRCIGCGVCVPTCPVQAIALQEKPGMEEPPLNLAETFRKMKAERELP